MSLKPPQNPLLIGALVVAAVVLLAPYAGCHLLVTAPPQSLGEPARTGNEPLEQSSDTRRIIRDDRLSPSGSGNEPTGLSDIEELLGDSKRN